MNLNFSRDECLNLEESLRREWLETNGLGGYASSTLIGCHTRKYHGLLVAPVPHLNDKIVFLSKVEPSIHLGEGPDAPIFRLSTNKYPEVFHPTGHKYIKEAHCQTHPQTFYQIGDILFESSLILPQGEQTVVLKYHLHKADKPISLHLRPWLAYRSIHALAHENMAIRVKTYVHDHFYKIDPYEGLPPLFLDTSLPTTFYSGPYWNYNLEYLKERSRGFDYQEDLFCPGVFVLTLKPGDVFYMRASLVEPQKKIKSVWEKEEDRRKIHLAGFSGDKISVRLLKSRAQQFLIKNSSGKDSIIAGYHWFNEWGRDAMIALPGLTLECDDSKTALSILKTFAEQTKQGLIPNYLSLDPHQENTYNSIDASLWFFWAVQQYYKKTKKLKDIKTDLWPALQQIIKAFAHNEVPNVYLQDSGLIWAGNEHTQLTWMDAQVNGKPVTSRYGLVVELNALWYNALYFYAELCKGLKVKPEPLYTDLIQKIPHHFKETFWIKGLDYLADVVNDHGRDISNRPNQIFAVSLPYSILALDEKRQVVACVESNLLTPFGLRTLSPQHPDYHAEYHGSPAERDSAYHQGTVWPWLVGHFTQAYLDCAIHKNEAKTYLSETFHPLFNEHLRIAGVGGISEIFNGDPPHTQKGCIHQAWSVAETIRAVNMINSKETS